MVTPDLLFSVDSCLTGCRGWSNGEYFHSKFPEWIMNNREIYINKLEALALIVGLKIWRDKIQNKNVLVYCDNQVTVDVINTGRARNKFVQACLREACWITAKVNTIIKVVHLTSEQNRMSDSLSRWHLNKLYQDKFKQDTMRWRTVEKIVDKNMFDFEHNW